LSLIQVAGLSQKTGDGVSSKEKINYNGLLESVYSNPDPANKRVTSSVSSLKSTLRSERRTSDCDANSEQEMGSSTKPRRLSLAERRTAKLESRLREQASDRSLRTGSEGAARTFSPTARGDHWPRSAPAAQVDITNHHRTGSHSRYLRRNALQNRERQHLPFLGTLNALAKALNVPLRQLFAETDERRDRSFVSAGAGVRIERRGTKAGHLYDLLGHSLGGAIGVEPYLITLAEDAVPYTHFRHAGIEFLYMLSGKVWYRHGDRTYLMEPGDALFFDAAARHGPEKLVDMPMRYLSIIIYPREK
jgi:mannose-6-phosphate isomerase-like protein (cupin superfamily)